VRPTNDVGGNLLSRLEASPAIIEQGIANLSRRRGQSAAALDDIAIESRKAASRFSTAEQHPAR
jgi:hypothetical protein